MPSMRRPAVALIVVAALGLAACGGTDGVEEVTAPAPAAPAPEPAPEPTEGGDQGGDDDYWSGGRLAALEAAKKDYVAPTPPPSSPPAPDTAGDPAPDTAGDPAEPASAETAADETPPAEAGSHRIEGHVDVPDHVWLREYSDDEPEDGDECRREQKDYRDVRSGSELTVTDGDGEALASAELEAGTLSTSYEDEVGTAMDCRLPFTVEDVPTADSYTIELRERGELTFAFDDLERQGWTVAFTIDW